MDWMQSPGGRWHVVSNPSFCEDAQHQIEAGKPTLLAELGSLRAHPTPPPPPRRAANACRPVPPGRVRGPGAAGGQGAELGGSAAGAPAPAPAPAALARAPQPAGRGQPAGRRRAVAAAAALTAAEGE